MTEPTDWDCELFWMLFGASDGNRRRELPGLRGYTSVQGIPTDRLIAMACEHHLIAPEGAGYRLTDEAADWLDKYRRWVRI